MKKKVAVIAPMLDETQYNADFALKIKDSGRELSLATIKELLENGFHTDKIMAGPSRKNMPPASGFYLTAMLRKNNYDAILTHHLDEDTLIRIGDEKPIAVCLSTTMILYPHSLKKQLNAIKKHIPQAYIILGGIFVYKSFLYSKESNPFIKLDEELLLFQCKSNEIQADAIITHPHGKVELLSILNELKHGRKPELSIIPNTAWPLKDGTFGFSKNYNRIIDYNKDFTAWNYIDDIPPQIPIRTSVGCPFRCRFCDFYQLFPKIVLRSVDSLKEELCLIKKRIGNSNAIVHVTDDNVFLNQKRIEEVCNAFIDTGIQRWMGFMRASSVNSGNIGLIRKSGLMISLLGIESGDKGQLKRMNKLQNIPDIKNGIEILDQNGITCILTFVMGFPGETQETIMNTASFLNGLDIGLSSSSYMAFPLTISPFSDLAKKEFREKWNIKGYGDKWEHYSMNSNEAKEACRTLFENVETIAYHHSQERTFFNREAFSDQQRKQLTKLRQQLTLAFLKKNEVGFLETFMEMGKTLNMQINKPDINFINNFLL